MERASTRGAPFTSPDPMTELLNFVVAASAEMDRKIASRHENLRETFTIFATEIASRVDRVKAQTHSLHERIRIIERERELEETAYRESLEALGSRMGDLIVRLNSAIESAHQQLYRVPSGSSIGPGIGRLEQAIKNAWNKYEPAIPQ